MYHEPLLPTVHFRNFYILKTTKRIRRQFEEDFVENFENGSNLGKNCNLIMLSNSIFALET